MASAATSTAALRADRALSRRFWLIERSAASLVRFRVLAACGLSVHFAAHWLETPALFGWSFPEALALLGQSSSEAWTSALSPRALSLLFGCAVGLAISIALGVAPRACAALLYVISIVSYRIFFPIAGLDDYLANVTTLFLILMPSGRAARPPSRGWRAQTSTAAQSVSGIAAAVFLSFVILIYLTSGFGQLTAHDTLGPVFDTVVRLLPAAFVLPVSGLCTLGVALQLAIHAYLGLTTSSLFANIILAASGALFYGERERPPGGARLFDAGAVVALLGAAIGAVLVAGALLGQSAVLGPATRAFFDAGLLPAPRGAPFSEDARLSISVSDVGTEHRRTIPFPSQGRLARRLVARIGNEASRRTRLALASAVVRAYCREQGYLSQQGVLTWSGGGSERLLAEFECGPDGTLSAIR